MAAFMRRFVIMLLVSTVYVSQGSSSTTESCTNMPYNQSFSSKATEDLKEQVASLQSRLQAQEAANRILKAKVAQLNTLQAKFQAFQESQCPPLLPVKWRGHCYGLFRYRLTYHQAQNHCRSFGANLVWIQDRAEQTFLMSTFSPQKIHIWIGCNDISHEGRFVWVHNNRPVTYSNWEPGEPNNHGNEDCCHIGHNLGRWNDYPCSNSLESFICKK